MADYKILLVEDFEEFRRFVFSLLQKRTEFQIYQASDGLEAIQRAEELQPDLALLDIRLPGLNGIEAARRIREVSPNSKLIFVSQEMSADIVQETIKLGARGYLLKSDVAGELLSAVDAVLQGDQFFSLRLKSLGISTTEIPRIHEVAFHQDDASFVDDFTRFIEAALKASNPVLVMATESHRVSIIQRLQARGWDIIAAIQEGSYISADASDTLSTFMINDWPDRARFFEVAGDLITQAARAAKGKHSKVAVCGECAPTLWRRGKAEAAIEVEHLFNELARSYDIETRCGYLLRDFQRKEDSQVLRRVCAEHSATHFPQGSPDWYA